MGSWSFLTTRARVLLCIAGDPGARLRDIAARRLIHDEQPRLLLLAVGGKPLPRRKAGRGR